MVVHAQFSVTHGVIAAVANRRPWVLSVWGSDVIAATGGRLAWWQRRVNTFAISKADVVCSTSHFMRDKALEFVKPGGDIEIVPFGVDVDAFHPPEARRSNDGQIVIGYAKALIRAYGPDVLIRAFSRVRRDLPDVRLHLAGGGAMEKKLKALAIELGVGDSVVFEGFVQHSEMPEFLQEVDIFVNCSVVPESFGVAVLEASAVGLPVVATRIGGLPEVCTDGLTGILVSAGDVDGLSDALRTLAESPTLRERLGRAGRDFVKTTYDWRESVDQMLGLLAAASPEPH